MAGNCNEKKDFNCWIWLEMAGNGWKGFEMEWPYYSFLDLGSMGCKKWGILDWGISYWVQQNQVSWYSTNRPGEAGDVLQIFLSLINSLSNWLILFLKIIKNQYSKTVRTKELKCLNNVHHPLCVMSHMSRVRCHISCVTCQVSHVIFFFLFSFS